MVSNIDLCSEMIPPIMFYFILLQLLRGIIRTFFRSVEVVGQEYIPRRGPVIFVGNHPNSLLDPALILVSCRRRVSFAAKNTLFHNPMLRPILKGLGVVPVFRRQDHKIPVSNEESFASLLQILRDDGCFGIFPEGISHAESQLAPLKTGTARLVLAARKQGLPLTLIPCGLTYRKRTRLRARVLIQYGEPVEVPPIPLLEEEADGSFVAGLTSSIEESLKALTINAPDFDTLRVLDGVRRLYCPKGESFPLATRVGITRRFIDHYERLATNEDVATLYKDVEFYLFRLYALHLMDRDVVHGISRLQMLLRALGYGLFVLLWMPLGLPGIVLHAPTLYLAVLLGEGLVHHKDRVATFKVIFATILFAISYGVTFVICLVLFDFPLNLLWALAAFLFYLVSAKAGFYILERQQIFGRGLFVLAMVLNMKKELVVLAETREELRTRILALVDQYYSEDEERLIPKEAQS